MSSGSVRPATPTMWRRPVVRTGQTGREVASISGERAAKGRGHGREESEATVGSVHYSTLLFRPDPARTCELVSKTAGAKRRISDECGYYPSSFRKNVECDAIAVALMGKGEHPPLARFSEFRGRVRGNDHG